MLLYSGSLGGNIVGGTEPAEQHWGARGASVSIYLTLFNIYGSKTVANLQIKALLK